MSWNLPEINFTLADVGPIEISGDSWRNSREIFHQITCDYLFIPFNLIPICSTHGIFIYLYHRFMPNVASGICCLFVENQSLIRHSPRGHKSPTEWIITTNQWLNGGIPSRQSCPCGLGTKRLAGGLVDPIARKPWASTESSIERALKISYSTCFIDDSRLNITQKKLLYMTICLQTRWFHIHLESRGWRLR